MKAGTAQQDRVWSSQFIQLFMTEVCFQMGFYMTRPMMSGFAVWLGASVGLAGIISGLGMGIAILMRPATGIIADFFSKKSTLVAAFVTFMITSLGLTISPAVEVVAVFAGLQGIALCLKSISLIALTVLVVPASRRGEGVGWIGIVTVLAMAFGPLLGTPLMETLGYRACFIMAAVLFALGAILAVNFKAPKGSEGLRTKGEGSDVQPTQADEPARLAESPARKPGLLGRMFFVPAVPYMLVATFLISASSSMTAFLIYLTTIGVVESGQLYFALYATAALISRPLAGRLVDTKGFVTVALPGLVIGGVGIACLVFSQSMVAVCITGVLAGAGFASAQCAVQTESVHGVDVHSLGSATNTLYLGFDLGGFVGPAIAGFILQALSAQAFFITIIVFVLIAVAVVLYSAARKRTQC